MKFIELAKKVKESILPIYLLKGDDDFVINSAIKHISTACGNDMADFNQATFNDENFSATKVVEAVMMMPLGVKKRFVLIKNISKLSESDKHLLSEAFETIPETTCVAIVYNDAWKFLKAGMPVDCGKIDFDMLSKYIALELRKSNKQITHDALKIFIELCSYNMTKISTELKKISYYNDDTTIEKQAIIDLVNADEEFQIFELTECLGNKNGAKSLRILSNFLERKQPIQILFSMICNHFRRMAHASISGMPANELADLLNVKEYAIIKAKEQSKFFSKVQFKNILELIEEVDTMIKTGVMTAENAIYYLVFKILYC